jgi:light-regulated signal transduction histidine kinase (bacteriophytochrome)
MTDSDTEVIVGPLPVLRGYRGRLAQLFQNLLTNAIKFRGKAPLRIEVRAVQRDGEWLFSVADNGIGFESEYREKIFKMFQRLHGRDRYPGSGVGLAIARKVVEGHGGRIWAESEANGGATFYFTLPGSHANQAG